MSEDPKSLFEDAVRRLDPAAAHRLRQARRAALAGATPTHARQAHWLPATAAAAALVLGLAWWLPQRGTAPAPLAQAPTPPAANAGDDDAVLAGDGEDADLYAWLAEAPVAAEAENREQRL
jgi:hypothetical protein